jgi:hypothetical protein
MNERIYELAVQAEKLADEATNAYNDDTGNWQKVWNKIYDEKFAELIVKECLGDLKERIALRYQGDQKDRDIAYGMEIVYLDIVDNFGVK